MLNYYYVMDYANTLWSLDETTKEIIPEREILRRKIWRKKNVNNKLIYDKEEFIDENEYIKREIARIMFNVKERKYKTIDDLKDNINISNIEKYIVEVRDFTNMISAFLPLFLFSNFNKNNEYDVYIYCKELIKLIYKLKEENPLDSEVTYKLTKIIKKIITSLIIIIKKNKNNEYIKMIYINFIFNLERYGWDKNKNIFYKSIKLKILYEEINNCINHINKYTNFYIDVKKE